MNDLMNDIMNDVMNDVPRYTGIPGEISDSKKKDRGEI